MRALTRIIAAAVLAVALWSVGAVSSPNWMAPWTPGVPTANAQGVEYLMVPSPAMGRDIPVAFQGGGPHAVVLLDAFNAAPDVSNWVTAGNAMNTLAGSGISVAAPAGGAWSMYTNWEQDGSKQWETFLADELPNWLSANKGLAPGGHGIVGAAQGGTGALTMATFHPNRYRFAGTLSGFLTPSATALNGAITAGMAQFGGVNTQDMWGSGTVRPVEVARPQFACATDGRQQHPAVGVQPGHHHVQRPARDDQLLRAGSGQQPHLLRSLPRYGRGQRSHQLPGRGQP